MNKITVIGAGNVGSTIAYTLTLMGLADNVVLIDINGDKAAGEALDIRQGVPFVPSFSPAKVYAGSYEDAKDSDIVVITSGVARREGQSRLDLAQTNVNIIKSIAPQIVKKAPEAKYIIVSNPVDILTYAFIKYSGLPESQVMGSGTMLDTSRLRSRLSEYFSIDQKDLHAFVLGEHGDTAFVPWSTINISSIPIDVYAKSMPINESLPPFNKDDIEEYVRKSGGAVIQRKGATFYAVSVSVYHLCRCLLDGVDTHLTVSTMLHGEYGIYNVCLSLVNAVSDKGAHSKLALSLNDAEILALHKSSEKLKTVIKAIEF